MHYELVDEMQQVNQAYEWYIREHVNVTPALLNACFAPNDPEWRALRLQERSYDREIERKIRVLMDMQKSDRATEPIYQESSNRKSLEQNHIIADPTSGTEPKGPDHSMTSHEIGKACGLESIL